MEYFKHYQEKKAVVIIDLLITNYKPAADDRRTNRPPRYIKRKTGCDDFNLRVHSDALKTARDARGCCCTLEVDQEPSVVIDTQLRDKLEKMTVLKTFFIGVSLLLPADAARSMPSEYVVLLHGLARTSRSLNGLEIFLAKQNYQVLNLDYPSRKHDIAGLADIVRKEVVSKTSGAGKVHFITHSLGGIIVRYIQKHDPLPNLGRVVMLSPPNRGSEVVDNLRSLRLFGIINGPAGKQLGTDKDGVCRKLGKVDFELGVITGDRSINWINSMMIPGKDDGKVSVESAKVEGMTDFLVVHASHPFIMNDETVMARCLHFLRYGRFTGPGRTVQRKNMPRRREERHQKDEKQSVVALRKGSF